MDVAFLSIEYFLFSEKHLKQGSVAIRHMWRQAF